MIVAPPAKTAVDAGVLTFMIIPVEVAVEGVAQVAFEVISTETTSLFIKVVDV